MLRCSQLRRFRLITGVRRGLLQSKEFLCVFTLFVCVFPLILYEWLLLCLFLSLLVRITFFYILMSAVQCYLIQFRIPFPVQICRYMMFIWHQGFLNHPQEKRQRLSKTKTNLKKQKNICSQSFGTTIKIQHLYLIILTASKQRTHSHSWLIVSSRNH